MWNTRLVVLARLPLVCASLSLLVLMGDRPPSFSTDIAVNIQSTLDHFLGYKIKDSRGNICSAEALQNVGAICESEAECGGIEDETDFCVPKGFPRGLQVQLADQFETGIFDVQKPVSLYNPADKNREGINDPTTHLKGYQIKLARTEPRQLPHEKRANLRIQNQFHPPGNELVVDTIKPDRLLVPTAKNLTQPIAPPDPAIHDVDHYKCYSVKTSQGTPRFAPIVGVSVVDQFQQPRLYDLKKPARLCTPVDKEGEGIKDPMAHLMCYQAKPAKGESKHEKALGIFVNNQFGLEQVDTIKEEELCVPSLVVTVTGCTLGATQSCYDGPAGTAGVGQCQAGTQTCGASGTFGSCAGQVLPSTEIPGNAVDEDCDGLTPACAPGATQSCYTGPAGTAGIGICQAGTQTCGTNGAFGACAGQVLPGTEIPDNGIDEDCNGQDATSGGGNLPPDPVTVAPPVDQSVATTVAASTEFLYTGANPIQTGVAPDTIGPTRAAVLRGKVLDKSNAPLPGVTINVLNHSEFGQTLSRADGMFDLAVNGGGLLTITYAKTGFLPVQRQVEVPWQDYAMAPDVVMMQRDTQVSTVDLTANVPMQAARGTQVSDTDGTRRATVLIPQGTQAQVLLPGGRTQAVSTLNIRLTEYTVGATGPTAMPAVLPPTSGYTYAVELSADEAVTKIGGKDVLFSQPVFFYLENFLNFPVGGIVPVGFYAQDQAAWMPSDNGRVIQIRGISGGLADLDTDGDGSVDNGTSLGVTDAERRQLAALYQAGQSLWRVPIRHFSTWDCNLPIAPPEDAERPDQDAPQESRPEDQTCPGPGSIIECQNQTLGERVAITGTPFSVNYRSDRVPGRRGTLTLKIPLSGASVPASLRRIELEIFVAGRLFTQTFPAAANQSHTFAWDGRDAYGRLLQGAQPVTVRIGYVYGGATYRSPDERAQSWARFGFQRLTGNRARQELTFWQEYRTEVGDILDFRPQGLGGWTLDVHHAYDPVDQTLYLGDGSRRSARGAGVEQVITSVTGARAASGLALTPDGSLYGSETEQHRIFRVAPDGTVTTVAGTGSGGCGGPAAATEHPLSTPTGLAPNSVRHKICP